jgi:anaerobic ribonucleoside-triphosphate reductase activating protein
MVECKIKILNIDTDCTDNGIRIRTVIYVSGCSHHCIGCHNPQSWNPNFGVEYSIEEIINIIQENSLADVTISGGDGLTYQYEQTLELVKEIKRKTNKNIWLYTGYTFEELLKNKKDILFYLDVVVDGRFDVTKKDLKLLFRGSHNQRIIDVKRSLDKKDIILWKKED